MHLEHVALIVDDYDAAIEFFVEVLGFELAEDSPSLTNDGRPKRWVVVRPPGARTGLLLARADGVQQTQAIGGQFAGRVGLFLRVDDFETSFRRMRSAGVQFVTDPRDEPYGRVAVFVDVAGNRWDLLGPRPSKAATTAPTLGRMATARTEELRTLAQRVADDLPAGVVEEVVLTGSVSRGMADDVSDVEMLVVTREPLGLEDCFRLARAAGLDKLDTWGAQSGPTRRVSGYREGVPLELIWWSRDRAEQQIDALLAGEMHSTADALAHGIALRTHGRLAAWQDRLRAYPPELAAAQIEAAALPWSGFAPAGLLTIVRPGDRLALLEWMLDGAVRVLAIVFALNRVWQSTTKRVAERVAPLQIKPDRLTERIELALTDRDARRALRVMTELQLDTVRLAPSGPNVDRARTWLEQGASMLRSGEPPLRDTPASLHPPSSPASQARLE